MDAQPAVISQQLIEKINSFKPYWNDLDSISLDLMRIEKQAKDLISKQDTASRGYTILGAINCVRGDTDAMIKNHENAIKLSPDRVNFSNYLASLSNRWLFDKALDIASKIEKLDPEFCFYSVSYLNLMLGNIQTASDAMKMLSNEADIEEGSFEESVIMLPDNLAKVKVSHDELQSLIKLMNNIMQRHNLITPERPNLSFGESNELNFGYFVVGEPETCSELNDELAFDFVEHEFSDYFKENVSAGFVAIDEILDKDSHGR